MTSDVVLYDKGDITQSFVADPGLAAWRGDMASRVAAGEMAEATARTYAQGMRRFLGWYLDLGQMEYGTLSPAALRAWKAWLLGQGLSVSTVNTFASGVRRFCVWAVEAGILPQDPSENVQGSSVGRDHRRDPLADAEVLRVLAVPDPSTDIGRRDRAMLYLMAYLGLRTIEVQRARIGDLRTRQHQALAVHGKGHADADTLLYLMHPPLIDALYDWLAVHPRGSDGEAPLFCSLANRNYGEALSSRSVRRIVKAAYRQAGVRDPRKTTHSLRHTLVTNLIRQNVPLPKIMSVTRHQRADTMMIYAHEVARDEDPAEAYVNYGEQKDY